jgi:UDP-N-acetylglucosamine diphosphorylase/glucosamine-1-phosphate N-acetyltransferase
MRLVLVDVDPEIRSDFYPLSFSRPIWELRCGMTSLREKLIAKCPASDVSGFVPGYMAESCSAKTDMPINDTAKLAGEDLLIVDPRIKADSFDVPVTGASEVGVNEEGKVLYARIAASDLPKLPTDDITKLLAAAKEELPTKKSSLPLWKYTWDLVLENPDQIAADFKVLGRSGIEGTIEEPSAIRGSKKDVFVGKGAVIHPMVVLDAENGPIYLDEDVEVHPFTRIEGPCFVGKKSILLGAKCREGNSIGPVCRVGGEVEESIIQGYSNKYHDGFLGHAYVGEWVNLGALTTNSDLKNDYGNVEVMLPGRRPIDTNSTKVGSLIGDHTKTSIATLLNTGSYVGAMALIMATGKPLPKTIPSFAWFLEGAVTKGFGKKKLYGTAGIAMGRRKCRWSAAEQAMWDAVFEMTAPQRDEAVRRGRKKMLRK